MYKKIFSESLKIFKSPHSVLIAALFALLFTFQAISSYLINVLESFIVKAYNLSFNMNSNVNINEEFIKLQRWAEQNIPHFYLYYFLIFLSMIFISLIPYFYLSLNLATIKIKNGKYLTGTGAFLLFIKYLPKFLLFNFTLLLVSFFSSLFYGLPIIMFILFSVHVPSLILEGYSLHTSFILSFKTVKKYYTEVAILVLIMYLFLNFDSFLLVLIPNFILTSLIGKNILLLLTLFIKTWFLLSFIKMIFLLHISYYAFFDSISFKNIYFYFLNFIFNCSKEEYLKSIEVLQHARLSEEKEKLIFAPCKLSDRELVNEDYSKGLFFLFYLLQDDRTNINLNKVGVQEKLQKIFIEYYRENYDEEMAISEGEVERADNCRVSSDQDEKNDDLSKFKILTENEKRYLIDLREKLAVDLKNINEDES